MFSIFLFRSVDRILEAVVRVLAELEQHAEAALAKAQAKEAKAQKIIDTAQTLRLEHARATRMSAKLKEFLQ